MISWLTPLAFGLRSQAEVVGVFHDLFSSSEVVNFMQQLLDCLKVEAAALETEIFPVLLYTKFVHLLFSCCCLQRLLQQLFGEPHNTTLK